MSEANIVLPHLTSKSAGDTVVGASLRAGRTALRLVAGADRARRQPRRQVDDRRRRRGRGRRDGLHEAPGQNHDLVRHRDRARAFFHVSPRLSGQPDAGDRNRDRLPDGRQRLLRRRTGRDEAGGQRQRAQRQRRADQLQGRDGDRVQGRRRLGHVHGRLRPARRDHHLPGLPAKRDEGADRIRLRRLARRALHARGRRHLHQGG